MSATALDVPAGWSCIPSSVRTTDDLVTPTLSANGQRMKSLRTDVGVLKESCGAKLAT